MYNHSISHDIGHSIGMWCQHDCLATSVNSPNFGRDDALEEIYKTLVPGGSLGMIWSVEDCLTSLPFFFR